MQARIIINIAVGTGFSDLKVDYEERDGTVEKVPMAYSMIRLTEVAINRSMDIEKLFAISLLKRIITPKDRWFWRNVCRIRNCLQGIIDEKRKLL